MGMFDFFSRGATKRKVKEDKVADIPQPTFYDFLRGGFKTYADPVTKVARTGYTMMRQSDVISQPMSKLARGVGSMVPAVVGAGKRRDMLQKIVDHTYGFGDMMEWLAWAHVEGVRFAWLKAKWVEDFDNGKGAWIPDFRGCGRMKVTAGGHYTWEGWHSDVVGKISELGAIAPTDSKERESAQAATFERERVLVFRPGAGDNPEGDLDVTLQLYLLADAAQELDKFMRLYQERYSVPREVFKKILDRLRPDEYSTVMGNTAAKIRQADHARLRMAMSDSETIEMIEPKGMTWQFLTECRTLLEARGHKLLTGEDISSGGAGKAGERGGHTGGENQFNSTKLSLARKVAEALNNDWLPFVEAANEHLLPRLRTGEDRPTIELRPPIEKRNVTPSEILQGMDRGIEFEEDFVYEVFATRAPREGVKTITKNFAAEKGVDANGDVPSSTGQTTQRKDREQNGSNVPKEMTRKRDPNEDSRNIQKDSE